MRLHRLLPLLALLLAGCSFPAGEDAPTPATTPADGPVDATPSTPAPRTGLRVEPWVTGFASPLLVVEDPRGGELLVVEQAGRIWNLTNGTKPAAPWLDISALVKSGGEQGLLGLALEPGEEGRVYVSYTDLDGDSVLARHLRTREGGVEPEGEILLTVDQPFANHNGGHLLFGPDGMLYVGLGDGGGAGDPQGNGQDPHALLGSLLRLDVSPLRGYVSPDDNPWADGDAGAPQVWAKGLRNPWRFSFDDETGDLWIADVGQREKEEVNVLRGNRPAGANFGWNAYEGTDRYGVLGRTFSAPVMPVAEYTHDDGCSVTGGHVHRGANPAELRGAYLFADYCSGKIWTLTPLGEGWDMKLVLDTELRISSFGTDETGNPLVVDHEGGIFRLVS